MIQLGSCAPGVTDAACVSYEQDVSAITRLSLAQVVRGADKFVLARQSSVGDPRVADVQRTLESIGFFPGGKVDGICGSHDLGHPAVPGVRAVDRKAGLHARRPVRSAVTAASAALGRQEAGNCTIAGLQNCRIEGRER